MSSDGYELYYWSGEYVGAGRAEFMRLIFEEAGVSYKHIDQGIHENFKKDDPQWKGYPHLAVPMLKKGSLEVSQTPVICRYLGKQFGLYPDGEEDQLHAEQVMETVTDYIAEGRLGFRVINSTASFRFLAERLPQFIKHFERILAANNGGHGFVVGKKITYVDLGLLHAIRATVVQFPEAWAAIDYAPLVKAFKDKLETRPNLAAYFKSGRCRFRCDMNMY